MRDEREALKRKASGTAKNAKNINFLSWYSLGVFLGVLGVLAVQFGCGFGSAFRINGTVELYLL